MQDQEVELGIEDLAERVGVSVRTIRFYIAEGLLPGPDGRGKAATYGAEHLLRLRLIRRLVEQRLPLAEIGQRVPALSIRDVEALLREEDRRAAELERAAGAPSPRAYVSALLDQAQAYGFRASAVQSEPARAYFVPPACEASPQAEEWRRWELAPGVELHVRAGAELRQQRLIEKILRAAGLSPEDT